MEWYEAEVRGIEQAAAGEPKGAVLFYGSSSIRLWRTLAADLAPVPVQNHAFGGSTLAACVHFFERLVVPAAPRSLICYAGDNDLGDGQSPAAVIGSFHALLAKVDRHVGPVPLGFMAIKPSPSRWHLRDQILAVNDAIRGGLAGRQRSYYIDSYHPMLQRDGSPRRELFGEDGLHLSPAGYRLWAQIVLTYRSPLLDP